MKNQINKICNNKNLKRKLKKRKMRLILIKFDSVFHNYKEFTTNVIFYI